ncbi:MAG TPA: hypothetical protein VHL55_06945 [Acidimicrobiia bacterium]|jgi:hypothetical protein|nr:hypothetical protein [Acidimicrobiia bacterium]
MTESETLEALRRAGKRFAYHLAMAGVEGLRAISAVLDELARVGKPEEPGPPRPERIDVE